MRFIPTRIHGVIDYLVGVLLILAPWLFNFNYNGAETWVPVALGIAIILYSLMTDYELGLVRVIPMPVHLWIDAVGGIVLLVSPWLFAFADIVWIPHVVVGIVEVVLALTTQTRPLRTHHERAVPAY